MSAAKFLSIVGAIIVLVGGAVASGVSYWFGRMGSFERHTGDDEIHLDRAYHRDHGRPVGRWDLDVAMTQIGRQLDDLKGDMKTVKDLQLDAANKRRR